MVIKQNRTGREAKYDKTASASQNIVYGLQLKTQLMEAKTSSNRYLNYLAPKFLMSQSSNFVFLVKKR
jgi:hypothetical protein